MIVEDLRDYLKGIDEICDLVGKHVYTQGEAPAAIRADNIAVARPIRSRHWRVPFNRDTFDVLCASKIEANTRTIAAVVSSKLRLYEGLIGTTPVISTESEPGETTYRAGEWWITAVEFKVKYKTEG
jgi:hypothetical protein